MSDYRDDDPTNPAHYRTTERECIDVIRDTLGRAEFIGFCIGNAMKYEHRAGLKPGTITEVDYDKARWYRQMANHVLHPNGYDDPRKAARGDAFVPYRRQP